jgi:uncharacterized protein YgfB (UPF0149 family)
METNRLPDFEATLAIARGQLEAPELAECHGVTCGLLCRFVDASLDAYLGLLDMLELVKEPGTDFKVVLEKLLNTTRLQLMDTDMGLSLWLPNDDELLEERTMALAQWCSGFLAGLGSSGDDQLQALSDESNDALKDLQQISMADVADTLENEEDECAFVEIVEYIRVVVLMIRADLSAPGGRDLIH